MADLIGQGSNGYVDETTGGNTASKPITLSFMVFALGQAPTNYQGLMGLSQPSGDRSMFGVLCPGGLLRLEDCDSTGNVDLVTDTPISSLSAQQQTACRVVAPFANNQRQIYLDNSLIATDTRVQTGHQLWKTLGINYGLCAPVSTAAAVMYSGYATAADVANIVAGYDARDVARMSSRRLTVVRMFLMKGDFTEASGLYNGFLNNSTHRYDRLLELDSNIAGGFGTKTFPSITWSGNGAVQQPQIVVNT